MSGRVKKSHTLKTDRRNVLLELILKSPSEMKNPCSFCLDRKLSCVVSSDSDRCSECVRLNQPRCDAKGLSPQQLRKIGDNHSKLESDLEAAEDELLRTMAKVQRLRKQKKLWFEKMMRAVSRGIDDLEELERVEREEAEKEQQRAAPARPPSSSSELLPPDFISEWDAVYPEVALSPSILAEFGLVHGRNPGGSSSSGS